RAATAAADAVRAAAAAAGVRRVARDQPIARPRSARADVAAAILAHADESTATAALRSSNALLAVTGAAAISLRGTTRAATRSGGRRDRAQDDRVGHRDARRRAHDHLARAR